MKKIGDCYKKGGWIASAIKNPGAFTEYCKNKGYSGVTENCISEGKKSTNATTRKRANLTETLSEMPKKDNGGVLFHKDGGVMKTAYIPYGKMHRHEHGIQHAKLGVELTKKGIPVVSEQCESGKCQIVQSAEIEASEIIFTESSSKKIEGLVTKMDKEKDSVKRNKIALELGKLVREELAKAEDATGKFDAMIKKIKA